MRRPVNAAACALVALERLGPAQVADDAPAFKVAGYRCSLTFTREELEASAEAGRELLAEKVAQAESQAAEASGICRCKGTGLVDLWTGRAWRQQVCVCRFPWGVR